MVNYSNGKIYKIEPICEHNENEIYIGSTTKKYLSQRMDKHRSGYKSWQLGKGDKVMSFELFDKFNIENCKIILIESVDAKNKDELYSREAHFIKNTKCINKIVPFRTRLERLELKKEYYTNNKERLTEQYIKYKVDNKDKISESGKVYYVNKKEKIIDKVKQYYEDNKEKILEKHKERLICECGGNHSYSHKSRHLKSKMHCDYIESKSQNIII